MYGTMKHKLNTEYKTADSVIIAATDVYFDLCAPTPSRLLITRSRRTIHPDRMTFSERERTKKGRENLKLALRPLGL